MEKISKELKTKAVTDMRDGMSDADIVKKYDIDPKVVGYIREGKAMAPKKQFSQRAYSAASVNSLNQGFNPYDIYIDNINLSDIYAVDPIRIRARDLERNTEYVPRYLTLMQNNIIGPAGIQFKSIASDYKKNGDMVLDVAATKAIEKAWMDWCYRGNCGMNFAMNFKEIQLQVLKTLVRDGEALCRKYYSKDGGFRLELVDPGRLNATYNSYNAQTNKRIAGGIELDEFNNPIAFHLGDLNAAGSDTGNLEVVPAENMVHLFRKDFPTMIRGISWIAPVMESLHQLDKYTEATVIASRVAASTSAFITSPDEQWAGDDESPVETHYHLEPGTIGNLNPGEDIKFIDPKFPQSTYSDFVNVRLMHISSALNVSYAALTGDRTKANNASQRISIIEEQDGYRLVQNLMVDDFVRPVFKEWLKFALSRGDITLPTGKRLTIKDYDKYAMCQFLPRDFTSPDPLKDGQVMLQQLAAGTRTWSQIVTEGGGNPQEMMQQLAQDVEMFEQINLIYPAQGSIMPVMTEEVIEVDE